VLGAFDAGELVGFAMAIPGTRAGHAYLHSHMLAVREPYRNTGLGRRLKLLQCREALTHGYELIEWTFDPLEIKNAHLNLARLGAVARRYNANQYGCMTSALQGGLPSDRLVAEWWLRSKRLESVLRTRALPPFTVEREIQVPAAIDQWKSSPALRSKAEAVQARNREKFNRVFAEGLTVLGFQRDPDGSGTYLLGRWDEKWSYAVPGA
jgi:predicted GNAT superfamily acetyltransferase